MEVESDRELQAHLQGKESMKTEMERRIYYQGIVYAVCTALDLVDGKRLGNGIVCGTADEPSTAVQQRIATLANEVLALRAANETLTLRGGPEKPDA